MFASGSDDLTQVLLDPRVERPPRRGAAVGRVPNEPILAHCVAVQVLVGTEPIGPISALDAVDVVEGFVGATVLRLPLELLRELGLAWLGLELGLG